jgi:hypothetical protein
MRFQPLHAAIVAAFSALGAMPSRAQAPAPAQLPWTSSSQAARAQFEGLGFRGVRGAPEDSVQVFTAQRGGARAELTVQYRAGHLWHAFYSVQGDSASVQQDLDRSAAALTARAGAPTRQGDGTQVWILRNRRRFALPVAAMRLEDGRFGYAAVYHNG